MKRIDCLCVVKLKPKGWKCPVYGRTISGLTVTDAIRNAIEREILDTTELTNKGEN